jgi:hypothetical protein
MLRTSRQADLAPRHLWKIAAMPIRAILFDAYGTSLDVRSAIARAGKELGAEVDAVSRP